jgi:hypothetical protein
MTLLCFTILPSPSPSYLHIKKRNSDGVSRDEQQIPREQESTLPPSLAAQSGASRDINARIDSIPQPTFSARQPIKTPARSARASHSLWLSSRPRTRNRQASNRPAARNGGRKPASKGQRSTCRRGDAAAARGAEAEGCEVEAGFWTRVGCL